jgi:[acyl-carrier-protein] S-malonyltransferase
MDIALVFPGQGSQKPGMGGDLIAAHPAAGDVFAAADSALGIPLTRLCLDGPAETLMETHNAQPALLTHGVAVWRVLVEALGPSVRCTAGHSLGEFTAHVAAGTFSFETAVKCSAISIDRSKQFATPHPLRPGRSFPQTSTRRAKW